MVNNLNKRAVVVFWDGWLSVSPSVINTLLLLHKDGYEVDCITRYPLDEIAEDIDFPTGINIHRLEKKNESKKTIKNEIDLNNELIISKFKKKLNLSNRALTIRKNITIITEFIKFCKFAKTIVKKNNYNAIIGVDTKGIVTAGLLFLLKKKYLIYFSLEIHFIKDYKYFADRIFKKLEKFFNKKCEFTIIQDKYRLAALFKENGVNIKSNNYIIVPNSPIGKFEKIKSTYFKDKFQFKDDDVIVLHSGGISTGYLNDEIAISSSNWDKKSKLVFHFPVFFNEESQEIERLKKLSNNNSYFSTNPVKYDELAHITASAHIGIAFYNKERGLNHSLIVGASGKMANYLRCGIPVIALNLPGFKELFDEYNCGIILETPQIDQKTIDMIMNDYENLSINAARCYDEVYEFENHFKNVLDKINSAIIQDN